MKARSPEPVSTTARNPWSPASLAKARVSWTISGVDRQLSLRALSTVTRPMRPLEQSSSFTCTAASDILVSREFARSLADRTMPLQNRVTPEGDIIATPHRGLMMGNRGGCFHLPDRTLGARRWATRQWIACVLEFKGRHRQAMMQLNRYTELFFLDEATALAAGHRPCFECRRRDAERFAELWAETRKWPAPARAPEMDLALHGERVGARGQKVTYRAQAEGLPGGSFVRLTGEGVTQAYLVEDNRLLPWTPAGYGPPLPRRKRREVEVLTPRSIVAVLSAGYRPMLHPSATA